MSQKLQSFRKSCCKPTPKCPIAASINPTSVSPGCSVAISLLFEKASSCNPTSSIAVLFPGASTPVSVSLSATGQFIAQVPLNATSGQVIIQPSFCPPIAVPLTIVPVPTTISLTTSPTTPVAGQTVQLTATVSASSSCDPVTAPGIVRFFSTTTRIVPTGTVRFFNATTGATFGIVPVDASGRATLNVVLPAGIVVIGATFTSSQNFSSSSTTRTVIVSPAVPSTPVTTTTTLTSDVNPSSPGESVTLTATVTPASGTNTPTGDVTFLDGTSTLGTGTLNSSGVATLTISTLTAGTHSITAAYQGSTNFSTSTSPVLSQVVEEVDTTTTLESSLNPSTFGQSVTFMATVTVNPPETGTPTGTVTFLDGTTTLGTGTLNGSGEATLTTSTLTGGSHTITATYSGDSTHATSTSSAVTQVVNQDTTTTTLISSLNPSMFGQSVTFTATVTADEASGETPTGTVTFIDIGPGTTLGTATLDGTGQATLNISTLTVGVHEITATYDGDINFSSSTSPSVVQIVDENTTTVFESSVDPSVFGQPVTFTATVSPIAPASGTPTGTVTFHDATTDIVLGTATLDSNSQASITVSDLGVDIHSIIATYNGDADFSSSLFNITQTVDPASTTTVLTSSANPSDENELVTFTATVTAVAPSTATPTGTVTFNDGVDPPQTVSLSGGVATFNKVYTTNGSYAVTATYDGNTNFTTSSDGLTQTVLVPSTTTLFSVTNPSVAGQPVTFTATVANADVGNLLTPTGTVTFFVDGSDVATVPIDALLTASTNISFATIGSYTVTATYNGDSNFDESTSTPVTQVVNQATTTTTLSSSPNPSALSETVTFTATVVADAPSSGVPTGVVAFTETGVPPVVIGFGTLDGSGQATFLTSALPTGIHSITATYNGNASYASSTSLPVTQTVT